MCGGCKFSCLKKVPRRAHHQAGTRAKNTHLVARLGTFLNGDRRTLDQTAHYFIQTKMQTWKSSKKCSLKSSEIIKEEL